MEHAGVELRFAHDDDQRQGERGAARVEQRRRAGDGGDDRGAGERLFELPGNLAIAGAVYYTTFALITTLMLLNFLIAIFSEGYIRVQKDSHSTSSLASELSFLVKGWIRAAASQGKILNEKQLLKKVRMMIAAQETEMYVERRE